MSQRTYSKNLKLPKINICRKPNKRKLQIQRNLKMEILQFTVFKKLSKLDVKNT